MEKTLLTREELAQRWGVNVRTIINYEQEGIITRNPNIPVPRYNIEEINNLEGIEVNKLSPLEKQRLEKQLEQLKKENEELKGIIARILAESSRVITWR